MLDINEPGKNFKTLYNTCLHKCKEVWPLSDTKMNTNLSHSGYATFMKRLVSFYIQQRENYQVPAKKRVSDRLN